MSISLMLGVVYLLLLPVITVVIYSACVVASKTSEEAELRATKNRVANRPIFAHISSNNRAAWSRQSLRAQRNHVL